MSVELSEQELIRRENLNKAIAAGIDPYPAELFDVNCSAKEIHENYNNDKIGYKNISIAGRLMRQRIMGKASFAELQDSTGRIQLFINRVLDWRHNVVQLLPVAHTSHVIRTLTN